MKYQANSTALSQSTDCLIIGIYENNELTKSFNEIDQITKGYLSQLAQSQDLSGKIGQATLLHSLPNLATKRVLVAGCGKKGETTERQFKQIIQRITQTLKELTIQQAINNLTDVEIKDRDLFWNVRFTVETIEHSLYQFDEFKSKKADAISLQEIVFNTDDSQAQQAIAEAQAIANGVKAARNIANMPPNICTPSYLAVSRGSQNPAYMSILHFNNAPDKNAKPIVLVGKGLTFDAGGISLKPAADMDEMKYDMCGAASVLGTMKAIAELNLPLNVIGVLAGCENLPDGNAYRPGDILTTMNGLTVEVLNTDAEGRLVLCDALTYVERFEPQYVIDVATLTGACVVALGQHNSGLVSTDDVLAEQLLQAAQQTTDKAWRLPLSEEYQEQLKSPFADLANIGGRWGGAITAGAFLSNFTKKYTWAHLDIAGTAWLQGANKGATGRPVSLLTQFLINQTK